MPEVTGGQMVVGYWDFPNNYIDYPDVRDSMTLTVIDNGGNNLVFAGHAILSPTGTQNTLQDMCDEISDSVKRYRDRSLRVNVVGDIEVWTRDWSSLDETKNLTVNDERVLSLFEMLDSLISGMNRHRVINLQLSTDNPYLISYADDRKLSVIGNSGSVLELGSWCSASEGLFVVP